MERLTLDRIFSAHAEYHNIIMKINIFLFFFLFVFAKFCFAFNMMPLTTWIQGKEFSTLSVNDTVMLTFRCSVAYDVNKEILEEFTGLRADGLRNRIEKYRWVNSHFTALLMKDKKKIYRDNYIKTLTKQYQDVYESYFEAMKNSQPIPHSLSTLILASDIGVCNSFDKNLFDAYEQMRSKN